MKKNSTLLQYYFICCVICFSTQVTAQQTAQYSLWQINRYAVIPAYAGLENSLQASLVYRRQWLGLQGSPTSIGLSVHLPLNIAHGGVGLRIENDELGAEKNLGITASYAYHINIEADNTLSFAGGAGILQKTFNGAILTPADKDRVDGYIPNANLQAITPLLQAGLYYKNKNFNFGASFVQYSPTLLRYTNTPATTIALQPTFTVIASNKFQLGDDFAIEPAALFKADATQMQAELSSFFHYRDNIFVGAAFRGLSYDVPDAATASLGFKINPQWMLSYAYDFGLSPLRSTHTGSHELVLTYNYGKRIGAAILPKMRYNTRYY